MSIELPVDEAWDRINTFGWLQGQWFDDEAACLHGHIRRCNLVAGDAYLIEQVANHQGWGPGWNDQVGRTLDDIKCVLVEHRDITDADLADTFGSQWEAIVVLVRRAAVLTEDEVEQLAAARAATGAAARDAAWAATGAAAEAAGAAAWAAAWAAGAAAWAAARALVIRDLIGQHGFKQHHYDTLTAPWAKVIGPVHPEDEAVPA